jgi:PAS domain S-box-containing protein
MTEAKSSSHSPKFPEFLSGGGEMGERIRAYDWSGHPLGPPQAWPQSLKIAVRIMLTSKFAMWMGWGPEFYFFCNDAYQPTLGIKKTWALGASARKVWAEIWQDIGPRAASVVTSGQATWDESLLLFLERSGYPEETYHTFSYSPLPDDAQAIGGMLCVVTEDTERVIGERRVAMLRELASDLTAVDTEEKLWPVFNQQVAAHAKDIPFALIYLLDEQTMEAHLACAQGVPAASSLAPATISFHAAGSVWPVQKIYSHASPVLVENLAERFTDIPTAPWEKPARQAIVVPIAQQGQERPAGFLVAAINPYRPFDAAYSGFVTLLAGQIAAGLSNARAYGAERKRAEALAEIDRAKTAFFSNVSHEFRTPLTLMLGPVEDLLNRSGSRLEAQDQEQLQAVHRNSLRLLKLVNSLLDFSRIEAGRIQGIYEQVDLAAFSADLASMFAAAVEKAGMKLIVDCAPIPEPVFVDRSMWEKIVLNLISNAYKFTFEGEIEVKLRQVGKKVELSVRDTGTGIPADQVGRIFERFNRVEGARGRTHEGTGIGLALVQELVKLHGGQVRLESAAGKGSTFTVSLPVGKEHLPEQQVGRGDRLVSTKLGAAPFVEEALRWSPGQEEKLVPASKPLEGRAAARSPSDFKTAAPSGEPPARILLADDNADMRDYVQRLLSKHYEVQAAGNGEAALQAVLLQRPDLVLTDVMMPGLDGFGLVRELRANPATKTIPIILLSARAGEESHITGLESGADDYLIKPFSARELLARVETHLRMSRLRLEGERTEVRLRRASEQASERLEMVLESITDMFLILDRELRFTSVNQRVLQTLGMRREEIVGRQVGEAFPGTVGTEVITNLQWVIDEQVAVHFEFYYQSQNRWFENHAYPSPEGVTLFSTEITNRKKTEAALRESEERFRLSTYSELLTLYEQDARLRYTWLHPSHPEHTTALGRTDAELLPVEEAALLTQWKREVLTDGVSQRREIKTSLPTGTRYYDMLISAKHHPNGEIVGVAGAALDITERKQAEEAVKRSEQLLSDFFENAAVGLHWVGPDGTILRANRAELELLGYSAAEYIGHNITEFHADPPVIQEILARLQCGQTLHNHEARLRCKDGSIRQVLISSNVLRENGEFIHTRCFTRDVTQQKLAEQALRESQERLRLALEAGNMGTWEWNISSGRVIWSPSLERMHGLAPGSFDGSFEAFQQAMHPKDRHRVLDTLRAALEQGSNYHLEYCIVRPDQEVRWVEARGQVFRDAEGKPQSMTGVCIDITARKQSEAALLESEERFRTMADATPTMVWLAGLDKRCYYLNQAWLEFTGRTLEQEAGTGWAAGVHADDRQRCLDIYTQNFDARQPFRMEYRLRRHDGRYRWILDHGVPRFAPDGTFMGYIGGCTDIDDQKRAEETLEGLVAERTVKLRETIHELEAFSYSVSHDMRAPLRAMQGYARVLLEDHSKELSSEGIRHLQRISKSAERLDLLTRDLLAYSKIAKGEVELRPVDLRFFLETIIPEYPQFQPHQANITLELSPGKVLANESYLTQVVANLVGNAIKFVPLGTAPKVRIWSEVIDGNVKVWVEDNGIGIAPEHRNRLFQIFGRINPDKMYEGTGIGLSVVKKAVERMGGATGFESQPGQGSKFWFTLKQA